MPASVAHVAGRQQCMQRRQQKQQQQQQACAVLAETLASRRLVPAESPCTQHMWQVSSECSFVTNTQQQVRDMRVTPALSTSRGAAASQHNAATAQPSHTDTSSTLRQHPQIAANSLSEYQHAVPLASHLGEVQVGQHAATAQHSHTDIPHHSNSSAHRNMQHTPCNSGFSPR